MVKKNSDNIVHADEGVWSWDRNDAESARYVVRSHVTRVTPLLHPLVTTRPNGVVFYIVTRTCHSSQSYNNLKKLSQLSMQPCLVLWLKVNLHHQRILINRFNFSMKANTP